MWKVTITVIGLVCAYLAVTLQFTALTAGLILGVMALVTGQYSKADVGVPIRGYTINKTLGQLALLAGALALPIGKDLITVIAMMAFIGLSLRERFCIRVHSLAAMNFEWYAQKHPERIHGGQATCGCGSRRISTNLMKNGTYLRAHQCNNCGATLYVSPEAISHLPSVTMAPK